MSSVNSLLSLPKPSLLQKQKRVRKTNSFFNFNFNIFPFLLFRLQFKETNERTSEDLSISMCFEFHNQSWIVLEYIDQSFEESQELSDLCFC
ncbi:hypothetical protein AAC387_Pa04g2324 [Persea americana]